MFFRMAVAIVFLLENALFFLSMLHCVKQIKFGAFGVSLVNLSAPILVHFPKKHYFFKKLYFHILNIYLGLGLELRPQRIRDLAIVCP